MTVISKAKIMFDQVNLTLIIQSSPSLSCNLDSKSYLEKL